MKKYSIIPALALIAALVVPAFSQEAGLTVSRLVLGTEIVDREPQGVSDRFPLSVGKVYCFLEATDVTEDTGVVFVWFYEDRETARVEVPVRKGQRWRTYSSKKLGNRVGQWRVELQDSEGNLMKSVQFEVF